MRVYVAGPYSDDPEGGTLRAINVGHELMDVGVHPFIPHLSHYSHIRRPRPYEDWMRLDLEWLDVAQALVRLPGHSPGADREVARARQRRIPVFTMEEMRRFVSSMATPLCGREGDE